MLDMHIGPYQIIREMVQGGIGQSFEAVDRTRNKKVTLTELQAETVTPDILSRLYSEAKTLAVLNHPNIARMFGFIRRDDHVYLVTEFVEGQTLENIRKEQGKWQLVNALALMHQVVSGVAFAHGLGVIHGDLQPSNILLTKVGCVKILNFAIAHIAGKPHAFGCPEGSLGYFAPEKMAGQSADVRSDIYSMGMIFYELITGKSPFHVYGPSDFGTARDQFIPAPPSFVLAGLPKWLDHFLLRMLATDPTERFQSVKAAARALEDGIARAAENAPSERRLWRPQGAVFQPVPRSFVSVGGGRFFECTKNVVSAVARFPVRQACFIASAAKARVNRAFGNLDRALRRVSADLNDRLTPKPRLVNSKRTMAQRIKADWRRYAQGMSFLLLISVEGLYFRGANIFSLLEGRIRSGPSLNDAVDSMFAQIDQGGVQNDGRAVEETEARISGGQSAIATKKKYPVAVVESQNPNRRLRLPEKSAAPAPIRVRYEPPQKSADHAAHASSLSTANSNKEATAPTLPMSKLKEPGVAAPVETARISPAKPELNIKWEN